jgi:hypothetical protein
LLVQPEATVEANHLVVFLDEVVAGRDHSQRVLFADITLQTQYADVSILIDEPFRVADLVRFEQRAPFDA